MKVLRFTRLALLLSVICLFLHPEKLAAAPGSVPPGACLYALDPTAANAFQIAGAQSVYTACGVVSESSSSSAFQMEGAETLYLQNHAQVSVVGGASLTGQTYLYDTISGKDVQAVQTTNPGDPLSTLSPPTSGTIVGKSHTNYDMNSKPANNTISPGIYCGGLTIGNTNGTTFTFSPGVYILAGGGLVLNSQAVVKGTSVTFYNTSSAGWGCSGTSNYMPITISGQVTATLSAPTSGSFDGILFFGNRTGCSTKGSCVDQINGGSTAILNGALYFASDEMEITASNATGYTMLVADKVYINGNSTFGIDGDPLDGITVAVSPATATLYTSQTQQFTATVTNTVNSVVNWSISPTGVGTVSSSGLYTAPANVSAQQTVTVTATSQADNSKSGAATITLAVTKTAPTITWPTPAAIIYGTSLSATQLDATANVAGTLAYTPAAGTVLTAGSQTLSVTFTPTNTTLYNSATDSVTLTVNKATPQITWATPSSITYGTALSATQLDATASVQGAFAYSPSAGTVLAAGNQTLTVTFTPTDTTDYTTATASVTLTVNKATPVITWATPPAITYGTALGSTQLNASSSVPGTFAYSPAAGTVLTAGSQTLTVTFTPTNTTDYTTATASVVLAATQATPQITWAAPSPITYGTALSATQLDATANVAGTVAYSPAAGTLLPAGSQTLTVIFTPTDTTDYTTATASVVLAVTQATPQITWATPSPITYGTSLSATQLDATANVAGTFAYSPAAGTLFAAGTQTLTVTFTPTDTTDYTTATTSVTLTVNKATPQITWATPASITDGTALSATQLDATANVPGTFAYSPAAGSVLTTGSQTLNVTFTPTDAADYTTATDSVVLTVTQPTQCNPTNGYSYQRTITIPHTNVPNTDQINFPLLFSVTDPLLATTANGGHVINPNGYDIIFTSDAAGQNPLNYEMEEYNPATGQVIAWVQIPNLSHTTDTTVYLFYGNSSITASQQNPTSVWDSNYKAVWHVPNGTQLSLLDSTSNGNNGADNGASAAAGQIDGGMSTNGSTYATIGTPADLANLAQGNATFSAWVNASVNPNGGIIMAKDDADISSGWTLGLDSSNDVDFSVIFNNANFELFSQQPIPSSQWTYVVVTMAGTSTQTVGTVYVNGVPSNNSTGGVAQTTDDSADVLYLSNAMFGDAASQPLNGFSDEFRISNTIRSADWIATEYANQSSPSTFYDFSGEGIAITPGSATLFESGTQQFTATALNSCVSGGISWSISPAGAGSITQNGFYTAPSSFATEETVTVKAASQSGASASATVTLIPPIAVSVTPAAVTITNGGEQRQFTATVLYTGNTAVTWSLSPSGAGTLDQTGLYTAPGGTPSQQIVTITATSQFDPTKSGSATVTLAPAALPPPLCATSNYSFMRPIVINHNLVPNTDQANFPFLFNTTNPLFATTDNGGHMTSLNGWDLIFTSDPAGQNPLNYELEEYDPAAGTVIAWIGIPNVSHTTDTVIYMFYGNSSITAPQQNPAAVWDSNFQTVFHMANAASGTALDSTANGFNGTAVGVVPWPGQIDGAGFISGFGGGQITSNYVQNPATAYTVEAWINTTNEDFAALKSNQQTSTDHSLTLALDGFGGCGRGSGCGSLLAHASSSVGQLLFGDEGAGDFIGVESTTPVNDGNWHHVVGTFSAPSGASTAPNQFSIYVDGVPASLPLSISSGSDTSPLAAASDMYMIGASGFWTGGAVDEFRISTIARSPDWIAAEYANQSSPSTFYQLYPENPQSVIPSSAALYAAQSEQFTSLSACEAAVTWSMPAGSPGALSAGGLYSAPPSIATPQFITVTATSVSNGTTSGTATVSLLPAITIGVAPASITLLSGQTQQFTATVANAGNSAVLWSLSATGAGTISSAGIFSAPANIEQVTTVIVTATLEANPSISASATVTLLPTVTISITPTTGLVAANQNLQFSATTSGPTFLCIGSSCASWSISPASLGSITNGPFAGVYTAPANIAPGQTVTVTGTITAGGVTESASATVTLIANSPTIAVEPASVTLTGGQSQQYFASIANLTNNAVTWTMSPTGTGTLSASGLYTAPPVVSSQQVITITATSQTEPSLTASAVLTLQPAQCAAKAYSYVRSIVIDHNKVPSTDQANFPFYFAVTDPLLASTANGGHMASPNGYDIEFSSDPSGQQILNYEVEQYNSATGQIAAWVQVPVLSHIEDTVIYMFYGNSTVTGSQQSPAGVWDSNYAAVYQFENLQPVGNFQSGTLLDSTANGNNSTYNDVQNTPGEPGGAGIFDGATSYAALPSSDFASYPYSGVSAPDFNASFGVWFKTSSPGVILGQTDGTGPSGTPGGYIPALYIDNSGYLRADLFDLQNAQQIVSPTVLNDNNWHYAVLTFDTNAVQNTVGFLGSVSATTSGVETLYVDGQIIGTQSGAAPTGFSSGYSYFLGTGYASNWADTPNNNGWFYFNGDLDEIEISSTARSSAWIQSEYNNQSSPSTFFTFGAEAGSGGSLNPLAVTLYQSQGQQFTVLQTGLCNAGGAAWSMPAGSPGSLSPNGLYTAPATIDTPQTVTVTAATLGANSTPLSATVTLMPPVAVDVSPAVASLPTGGTQQFTATVSNASNAAVNWSINPAGAGSISASGLYTAPATMNGQQTVSVIATSMADPTQSASATITIGAAVPAIPAVAVNPASADVYAGQAQQFTATVTNTSNTAVIWSMSPSGAGAIDNNGIYTAPASITTEQTVTITATSQADATVSTSASVILIPSCTTNGYSFVRQISINPSQVPNSDQANFPFLFSATDPLLATTANGGHVANPNGYDMIFTSDPAGQNPLNFEMEEYNPVTGQVVAWVNIPNLSHITNTVLYLFYGNPGVTASQQNPAAVWDNNFVGVWHLPNGSALSANDSTVNGSNGTPGDGVSATAGFIDGGASFNGASSAYISIPSSSSTWNFANDVTVSAWIKTASNGVGVFEAQENNPLFYLEVGPSTVGGNANVAVAYFRTDNGSVLVANGNTPVDDNNWHYIEAVRSTGKSVSIYVDGMLDSTTLYDDAGPIDTSGGGISIGGLGSSYDLVGSVDEVRVSNIARSADWIAAEYHNQNSPSTFYALSTETTKGILPDAVTLYPNQSQQFADSGVCGVTWSLSADAPGTLTSSGLYTAPSSIASQQTITVTATSSANPNQSSSATVTLMPPITVAVSPSSTTLNANQTQQFTALVTNSSDPAVNWSVSPAGAGSIDQTGVYTAPASITAQQTVTITATSVTDPTKSASAMITLAPSTCASTGYGYQRVIVIDHTKVANTDQINYPFLFNSTDPDLATVDNGGHVTNANGYDIIFSTDPNGQTKLDFEVEQYNPATGQLVAWIRIPNLSHSADTVIYVFYGNPAITTSQANPAGVWDSNYQAVYHLGNLPATEIASDSTNYTNNASLTNFTAIPGQIDGAASLDGVTSFLQIPSTAFPNYPTGVYANLGIASEQNNTSFDATYGIWFKTSSWGGLLDQAGGEMCTGSFFGVCYSYGPEQPGNFPANGSVLSLLDIDFDGQLEGRGVGPSTQTFNDDNWHYGVVTFENGVDKLYADGQMVATGALSTYGFATDYVYFVGTENAETDTNPIDYQPWKYLPGQIDEVNVSSIARSGDWIQTQFNNQGSPSAFYKFYAPAAVQVAPSSISLYASQSEQFTVPSTCDATISWSLTGGSLGTLTSAGLYTAPSVVSSQQTVTVSAASQSNGSSFGSAQVTLLPAPQPLTLVASSPSPYQVGATQSFNATLLDPQGNPLIGATVNFTVAGPNETVGTAATTAAGTATFTYTGSNSGTDAVQATASVEGSLLTSNSLSAAWLTPPPAQAPTITLLPQPSPGRDALIGAFTDNNGDLIEPIVVGTAARTFITPAGATQLQLGINDTYYEDNGGAGFVAAVNGVNVTVPPTAMPWNWKTGGLNNNYQYGTNDGSSPMIAASSLTAGQPVIIAYQSGTISTNYPVSASFNANGNSSFITGTQIYQGAYFPTLYTTGTAYPQNQPINVFATAIDASGAPIPNTPVTLSISGANPGQYQATTDATGTASFLYTGQYAGNDSLQAQATLAGQGTLDSNLTTIDWTNYPTPPPVGSLTLHEIATDVNVQAFSAFPYDASGNALPNENVGFYMTGADNIQASANTNNIGEAFYSFYHTQSGNYSVIAVDSLDRNVIVTQPYTGFWSVPTAAQSAAGGTVTVGIAANTTVTIPNALQLTGTATDSSGLTPAVAWTQVSGPGTVTFASPNQLVTTATFSQIGTYVLELSANVNSDSGWAQFTVSVLGSSVASQAQGWIGSPAYGAAVSGLVPITLAPGISIASGTLSYMPVNNLNSVTVLNANVSGTGQIGALDTTMLANGSYWIQMQATNTSGNSSYSLALVTVTGNYKPGRVTTTVTDLVVPSTGLAINIQRTYDSLNAGTSSDFGFGWSLGINVDLVVDPSGNVTFTLGGQRRTFYLTPQAPPCTIAGCLFPYYFVAFTPEPGLHGTLTDSSQGCPLDIVQPYGSLWECYGGTGQYTPPGYIYTDPTGTQYTIGAGGALQSIVDRSGNGLTITPNGITSTTGLNVPFVRDSQGRITQITDPSGNVYLYNYDANGNLSTVFYPNTPQPSTYTYAANHYYLSGTDFRSNPLPSVDYYAAGDTDAEGDSLAGKLKTVTDGLGETTSYAYDLSTDTTTVTYPPDASSNIGHATMVYDNLGDLLTSTDPLNHTTTNTYNANQDLLSTTDPLGHATSYTYDANGNKTSQTYPATATSTNTTSTTNYNQFSEPTSTTDELGNVRTFNYDANYNPASVTDSLGTLMSTQFNSNGTLAAGAIGYDITQNPTQASQFSYDANGDLISKTDALGRTTSYTYNALGQKVTMIEPIPSGSNAAAATTTYQYDAFGNLTQTSAPLGRITSSQYDGNSNKTSDTDARSNTTTYQYDSLNRLIETDYPDGTKATRTYDFRNNVVTETDQGGHVTQHQYDLAGRQVAVIQAYGTANATTTSYAYDNAGRKTSETDALGHVTNYTYDAAGNLLSVAGVKGNFSYAYDNARNQISQTDGNGNTTQYQYDARKRLTVTTYPDTTTKTNAYDGPGNLVSVTDQAQNVVQYSYDAANQLINVVQVNSPNTNANTTIYGYDLNGNPIALEDANTHTTMQSFDLLSELTQKTLPDGTLSESRTYDNNGNLATVAHFNGTTTTYTYDTLNRLLSRATPGETTVSHTYTSTGKFATTTDASGTTSYTYDTMDRLTVKATPEGTLNYTYDAAGHMASIASSNPNGASMSYTYDSLNRLSTVVDNRLGGSNTTTYSYDDASNVGTVTYPNGVQSTFTYDTLNRVSGLSSQPASYTYQRGPAGNLTGATESNGRTESWSYDGIYRLTNETISLAPSGKNGSVGYGLDPVGNRTSDTSSLSGISSGSFGYNPDDELASESYDQNGNVLATGGKTFTYDSQNELVSMGSTASLLYDADGNRVAKTVSGVVTKYLVDDLNPTGYPQVFDELTNGAVTRTYTYGLQRIDENQVLSGAWTPSFFEYDGGGNVRNLTNNGGAITDSYEYDAFGNSFTVSGSTPNNYLYRGEQYDPDLGLYYLRARYYNPLTGRFMSRDPLDGNQNDPMTLHKFLYAESDPVNGIDPTGRAELVEDVIPLEVFKRALVYTAVAATGTAVACKLLWDGTKFYAAAMNGIEYQNRGLIYQTSLCTWALAPPLSPPTPLPLPIPGPPPPPQKPPRCRDLNAIVDGIKATIGASGGACSVSLTPSENYARLALWNAYLNARLDERAECSQYDPNPGGHQQQIDQIWTNIINCEVILHEF